MIHWIVDLLISALDPGVVELGAMSDLSVTLVVGGRTPSG